MPISVDGCELSSEMQSIQIEWTPELEKIFSWGRAVHPYIGPGYERGSPPFEECYRPGMALPNPDDSYTFLKWCGLRDETIKEVSDKFYKEKKDLVESTPVCGYVTRKCTAGFDWLYFPILDGMEDTYVRMLAELDGDYEETYEGYVKKAIQRGFRPEFAIFCGLHEVDPIVKKDPRHLTRWFFIEPMGRMQNIVRKWSSMLMRLMRQKLVYEGKVRVDEELNYVIVDQQKIQEEVQTELLV